MKPINMKTWEVQALLAGRKTVTRRVVKPQPSIECSHGGYHEFIRDDFTDGSTFTGFVCKKCGCGVCGPHFKYPIGTSWIRPPYRPGDILYVRETWRSMPTFYADGKPAVEYLYKADMARPEDYLWHPSTHMPREAARIFLRVTDVRVEKLQDIREDQAIKEGAEREYIDADFSVSLSAKNVFADIWDSTLKPKGRDLYGWEANPWVWGIEFERISREEALCPPTT